MQEHDLWTVRYQDGDEEDYNWHELYPLFTSHAHQGDKTDMDVVTARAKNLSTARRRRVKDVGIDAHHTATASKVPCPVDAATTCILGALPAHASSAGHASHKRGRDTPRHSKPAQVACPFPISYPPPLSNPPISSSLAVVSSQENSVRKHGRHDKKEKNATVEGEEKAIHDAKMACGSSGGGQGSHTIGVLGGGQMAGAEEGWQRVGGGGEGGGKLEEGKEEEEMTVYELQRQANIRRNADILAGVRCTLCLWSHDCMRIPTETRTYTHTHAHTHRHIYAHTHTHAHTHAHSQISALPRVL